MRQRKRSATRVARRVSHLCCCLCRRYSVYARCSSRQPGPLLCPADAKQEGGESLKGEQRGNEREKERECVCVCGQGKRWRSCSLRRRRTSILAQASTPWMSIERRASDAHVRPAGVQLRRGKQTEAETDAKACAADRCPPLAFSQPAPQSRLPLPRSHSLTHSKRLPICLQRRRGEARRTCAAPFHTDEELLQQPVSTCAYWRTHSGLQ